MRQEREAARTALQAAAERDRALFFQAAGPVLTSVMEQRGALLVLDQRTVLISAETIDVTAATIAALDAALGDGSEIVAAAIAGCVLSGVAGAGLRKRALAGLPAALHEIGVVVAEAADRHQFGHGLSFRNVGVR